MSTHFQQRLPINRSAPIPSVITGTNADLLRACADLYLSPDDRIADLTFGRGVFWQKCPELNVTGSDLTTVPERPYDLRSTPYANNSFDVVVLDPPYIHSGKGRHITERQYRGSTVKGLSMAQIWQLYEDGMAEACRIVRPGGRILVKTADTIESGRQRWSHIHLANVGDGMGLYLKDLLILLRKPPCEKRWAGQKQRHSRKVTSYLLVLEAQK